MQLNYYFNFITSIKITFLIEFVLVIDINKVIKIDNLINESFYQENQNFTKFNQKYKTIALYYPNYNIHVNNHYYKTKKDIINNNLLKEQVKLAKSHGVYGFGIIFNWLNQPCFNETILNLFANINKLNFSFCLILSKESKNELENNHLNLECNKKNLYNCFDFSKPYFFADNYIKCRGKFVIGILRSPYFSSKLIDDIREYEFENGLNKFFIISIHNDKKNNLDIKIPIKHKIIFHLQNLDLINNIKRKYFYNFYYSQLINEEIINKNIKSFLVVNGSPPNKFFILFKKYLNNITYRNKTFVIINAWNNYKENLFLEPNNEYGYSYLNYFSKAIFNLEENKIFDLHNLNHKSKIAVQVHLFYEDLIEEIINKTNNIPVKFDLYITITSENLFNFLDIYIKNYSTSYYFEILLVENRGRDVLPFLNQIKPRFKQYKYICHIHSKKSETAPKIGFLWRNYLFNNLLGNSNIVAEIINDFEKNKKIGFIFPETFYGIIQFFYILTKETKYWMNFLSSKLFPSNYIGDLVNFPAGNMFWAKTNAIFQIFIHDLSEYFPKEDEQTNDTIMHAIERIWLFLVKYNHYKYKIVLYRF